MVSANCSRSQRLAAGIGIIVAGGDVTIVVDDGVVLPYCTIDKP